MADQFKVGRMTGWKAYTFAVAICLFFIFFNPHGLGVGARIVIGCIAIAVVAGKQIVAFLKPEPQTTKQEGVKRAFRKKKQVKRGTKS